MQHRAGKKAYSRSWRRWLRRKSKLSHPDYPPEAWQGFEPLEPRLLLSAPTFVTPLFNQSVPTTGGALTIGIDAADTDGNSLTITAVSDDPNLIAFIPQGNRFAQLNFTEADGTTIGNIIMELFETRAEPATTQFIKLATDPAQGDGVHPFYTDVPVHRVVPGFVIQTGDAQNGNGTGGSPLNPYLDDFDLQNGLSYASAGVVGAANSGPNTSDSQWFITAAATPSLNGKHMILGHMISGLDVFNDLINRPNSGSPNNATLNPVPLLASVDILDRSQQGTVIQDGTITFTALPGWDGRALVTVSIDDGTGNVIQQQITIVSPAVLGNLPAIDITGDQFIPAGQLTQFDVTDDGSLPINLSIFTSTNPQMPSSVNGNTGIVSLQPPADSNLIYDVQVQAFEQGFDRSSITIKRVKAISQTADAPPILSRASSLTTENVFSTFLDGNRLYVANGTLGLDVYDVSDPAAPSLLGFFNTDGTAREVQVIDNVAFIADGTNGLISLDVSNPASIQPLDITSNGRAAINFFIDGNIAYVASDDDGLITYDISDNTNITQLGLFDAFGDGFDTNDAFDVVKQDDIAFLSDPTLGVFAINVADPVNMTLVRLFVDSSLHPEGMAIDNDVLYITTVSGLSLFNVSTPDSPAGIVDVALTNLPSRVTVSEGIAVVSATGGFFFLDVSDPATPLLDYTFGAARFDGGQIGVDVAVTPSISGSRIALPLFNSGTLIMDGQSLVHRPVVVDVQANQDLPTVGGPVEFSTQRSELLNLAFTFSGEVSINLADVEVFALGMDPSAGIRTQINLAAENLMATANTDGTFDLTIDLQGKIQADGVFEVRLKPTLTAATGLTLHDTLDYVYRTHQLRGDFDGDGTFNASATENATFQHWFAKFQGVPSFVDTNDNGGFNILDMGPYVQSFGTTLTYNNPESFEAAAASASLASITAANTSSAGLLSQLLNSAVTVNEVQAPALISSAPLWQTRSAVSLLTASSSLQLVTIENEDDAQDTFITTQDTDQDQLDLITN